MEVKPGIRHSYVFRTKCTAIKFPAQIFKDVVNLDLQDLENTNILFLPLTVRKKRD